MMKLFYAPGTCALASHIALEEAGATFTATRVDFSRNEQQQPEYLAINPKGRVPALVTDRGILTENPAILAFIAQIYPDAKLAPVRDPFAFAQVQAFNSYLASTVHVAHAHGRRGYRWAGEQSSFDDMKRKLPEVMTACFDLIEREMFKGPWAMGEAYSICDPYLFTLSDWLESDGVDPKRFPKVHDHRTRMHERPAVKRALAQEGRASGGGRPHPHRCRPRHVVDRRWWLHSH
ncbi:MAG: glutathione S-transferase [Rhodospirillales bacterium]|nr:glutathione S-transferase [Rhodospirillales bacterium]